ncbi:histidine phosphatase family protein [Allofustis seminis]|uniref:histidine phosphatase family protein n=1 Tax=Allofustis seminis TaxID=166939 RepID=UPI00037CCEAF|nr:histidine phosphatase family protein [Allofustis seminis]
MKESKGVTIYFVRHGQTYFNLYGRMQGWANTPLTSDGEKGVHASGRGLADVKFDAVYTSDLQRTLDTAEIILEENKKTDPDMPIISMPEFREIFFGSFEGEYDAVAYQKVVEALGLETAEDLFKTIGALEHMNTFNKIDPYGHAETFMQFWSRVEQGLIELIDRHRDTGDVILLVAHGAAIHVILENLIPDLPAAEPLLNASVSKVRYENGQYILDSYGDVSHFIEE